MKAYFSTTFVEHMNETVDACMSNGQSTILTNQRQWYIPSELNWSGNPLDITGMNGGFERADLASAHLDALRTAGQKDGGRISDSRALKLQYDYISAEERAYRLSHATSIRCALHASVRDEAHAHGNGIYYGGIVKYIQDLMAAGYNGSVIVEDADLLHNAPLI